MGAAAELCITRKPAALQRFVRDNATLNINVYNNNNNNNNNNPRHEPGKSVMRERHVELHMDNRKDSCAHSLGSCRIEQ